MSSSTDEKRSYRNGLKFTSIFGGVQFVQVLVSLIRSKFVAVLLGPGGMGIFGLLSSAIQFITSICNLGLTQTGVRDISIAYEEGDNEKFSRTVSIFQRLIVFSGLFGTILCLFLSPLLSLLSFGNYEYTWAFILLSCTLLMIQMTNGKVVLLQSTKNMKRMAYASLYSSILGLVLTIPLYYIFGTDGIVPAMIITAISGLILYNWIARNIKYDKIPLKNKEAFKEGNILIKLGLFITLQGFFSRLATYLINIYIGHAGSIDDVGLYNSALFIIDAAAGMVYAAINSEYYPRLSSCSNDNNKFTKTINQQIHIAMVFLGPILALFSLFCELATIIFLSSKFLDATMMMRIAIFGTFFRGPALCYAYTFLSKGDTKAYWLNELATMVVRLSLHIIGYKLWGVTGLGIAYMATYVFYFLQSAIVCRVLYKYHFDFELLRVMIPQLLIGCCIFVISEYSGYIFKYTVGILLVTLSVLLVFKAMREKLSKRI